MIYGFILLKISSKEELKIANNTNGYETHRKMRDDGGGAQSFLSLW